MIKRAIQLFRRKPKECHHQAITYPLGDLCNPDAEVCTKPAVFQIRQLDDPDEELTTVCEEHAVVILEELIAFRQSYRKAIAQLGSESEAHDA